MKRPNSFPRLKGFRFPREIVAYAVWAYHRFALSTADAEDLLAERGVIVSRVNRFGRHFADGIRRNRPKPNDKWHMDEAVITIGNKKFWFWRAIDADGNVLDILVQDRRNTKAAKRFFSHLVKQFGEPRVVVTDKLRSYTKPIQTLAPDADHRAHKGLNNRIENSHRSTRKREKIMGRFKSPCQAKRFLSAYDQINVIFRPRRYNLSALSYRHARADAFCLVGRIYCRNGGLIKTPLPRFETTANNWAIPSGIQKQLTPPLFHRPPSIFRKRWFTPPGP